MTIEPIIREGLGADDDDDDDDDDDYGLSGLHCSARCQYMGGGPFVL